jgi:hypothetical protein
MTTDDEAPGTSTTRPRGGDAGGRDNTNNHNDAATAKEEEEREGGSPAEENVETEETAEQKRLRKWRKMLARLHSLPGVSLVTRTTPAVANWCLRPYAILGLSHSRGCQIGHMDDTWRLDCSLW